MRSFSRLSLCLVILALSLAACAVTPPAPASQASQPTAGPSQPTALSTLSAVAQPEEEVPDVRYTLLTGGETGKLVFIGASGDINGVENPTLKADPGDVVEISVINGDGIAHDLAIDEFQVNTGQLLQRGQIGKVTLKVDAAGAYAYYCTVPGHRQAGMWGTLQVGEPVAAASGESVVRDPSDLPPPIGDREPTAIRVDLTAIEVVGQLADGTTYSYFTFDGAIPGPMIRVRVGDTLEVHMKNETSSAFAHSIDLHAVNGPGGGAVFTQTNPGEETSFSFTALNPGLYVYHCATPSVAHHISNGMYGLILVEPEGGLPPVDREFYVMQGEIYTLQPYGAQGQLDFSNAKLLGEAPEYFLFNGAAAALASDEHALRANVGETVRIFFGVGGPNFTSSFHIIGEIFDRAYSFASLTTAPVTDVQTVTVPPGGAWVVEFKLDVPGRYILVDHALSRLERGLVGFLYAEGEEHPEIFSGTPTDGSGH
ncbi:MAG TPA: copper-containing nitrite reductase [Anaerolineales bacterium]|nr:copper-containing nitrite reductase [Anaerolineales bacterium]